MDYSPNSIGGHKLKVSVNPNPRCNFCQTYLQELSQKKFPIIPANIMHTCHVKFYVDFSCIEDVMGRGPNLHSCKLKEGVHDTLNQ